MGNGVSVTTDSAAGLTVRSGLRGPLMKYWYLYVGAFYAVWVALIGGFQYWGPALMHWRMALVMLLGSIVAGSTPMGGGTVAFPVLVLLFHQPAEMGRNFAMSIQALGMTSAMIFIVCRRTPIPPRMLLGGAAGAAIGLILGTLSGPPTGGSRVGWPPPPSNPRSLNP